MSNSATGLVYPGSKWTSRTIPANGVEGLLPVGQSQKNGRTDEMVVGSPDTVLGGKTRFKRSDTELKRLSSALPGTFGSDGTESSTVFESVFTLNNITDALLVTWLMPIAPFGIWSSTYSREL